MIKDEQPWSEIIHCTNKWLDLVVADTFKESDTFQKIDEIAFWIWEYFKNSGKVKSMLMAIASQLNVLLCHFHKMSWYIILNP